MLFHLKRALLTIIVLFNVYPEGNGIRTKDKMYQNIDATNTCFRRLNATHQVGCTSKRGGSTGVIHYCRSQLDLDFILKNGTAPPYIPIMPTNLFTNENVQRFRQTSRISGVLLYATDLDHFTHEQKCPNPRSSLAGTCKAGKEWNPYGTGLMYQDLPFPVFYVENEQLVEFARECFEKHNNFSFSTQRDRSLCSLQMNAFMYATGNTPTCIRRSNMFTNLNPVRFCDPLGDQNVWSSLFPLVTNWTQPRDFRYIVVAAKLDTSTFFDKTAGAVSPVTGLVTLLATAKYLKTLLPTSDRKNVLFVVFNGETFDYLGSQRFVYEMLKGNFPTKGSLPNITIDDIDLFVELSQLNKTGKVVMHYQRANIPKNFTLSLFSNADGLNLSYAEDSLPPGSLHTFLKHKDLPSVILADHQDQYSNKFYNSLYDNATNLKYTYLNLTKDDVFVEYNIQRHIQKIAAMLGKSLYHEITGETVKNTALSADLQLIDELLHCYLENANCRVHQAVQKLEFSHSPKTLYVGVERAPHVITTLVGLTLGWLTGDVTGPGNATCTNEPRSYAFRYYNMSQDLDNLNATVCYRITMNFTEAVSPAFVIDDYDWSSGEYSSWTESTWGDIKMRVFLKPSAAHENTTIAIGSMVFVFSLLFVYFVKSKSEVLFASHVPSIAPADC